MRRTRNYNKLLKGKTLYRNHRKFLGDITAQRIPRTGYIFLIGTPQGSNHCHFFIASDIILDAMCNDTARFVWRTSKGNFQLLTNY